jgi:hypothetical protein
MRTAFDPFSFLVTCNAGWINQHQHHVIDYLIEEMVPHATSSLFSRRLAIIVVVIKSQLQSRSHLGQRHNVLPSENINCTSQHSETYTPETGAS